MKRPSKAVLSLVSAVAILWPAVAWAQQRAGQVSRSIPPAFVEHPPVRRGAPPAQVKADPQTPILWNDTLKTDMGGRLRATLADGSILSLGSKAELRVQQADARTQQSSFQLSYGRVRAQVVRMTRPDSRFEIRTNTAVCGVLGTDEVVDASNPVATVVFAVFGVVRVWSSDPAISGFVTLNAGQATTVEQGKPPAEPRQATLEELTTALNDTSGGTGPEANVTLENPRVPIGAQFTLDGRASSGGLTNITGYLWQIPALNFTSSDPVLTVDTAGRAPGEYNGTLTVTAADGKTATVSFKFTLVSQFAQGTPQELITSLARAYESLRVTEFMKLFHRQLFVGYSSTEESVTRSFANIAENRVYVRTANIQSAGESAAAQVDFEIRFTPKPTALPQTAPANAPIQVARAFSRTGAQALGSISGSTGAVATVVTLSGPVSLVVYTGTTTTYSFTNLPDGTYTVTPLRNGFIFQPASRTVTVSGGAGVTGVDFTPIPQTITVTEPVTMRMAMTADGWLITDLQGSLGGVGLMAIPSTTNPTGGTVPVGQAEGEGPPPPPVATFTVSSPGVFPLERFGSTNPVAFIINPQNGFTGPVQVSFTLPTGITLAQGPATINVSGAAPVVTNYVFSAGVNAAVGQNIVSYTAVSGSISQVGVITLDVAQPTFAVASPGQFNVFLGGSSPPAALTITPQKGFRGPVQVTFAPPAGISVALAGQQPSGNTFTIQLTSAAAVTTNFAFFAAANAAPGAKTVPYTATGGGVTASAVFNLTAIVPFTMTGPSAPISFPADQSGSATLNVTLASGFPGPVTVTPPALAGLAFSPASVQLSSSGNAVFTVTATAAFSGSGNFTASGAGFTQSVAVTFNVTPAFDFSITGGTLTLAPGAGGTFSATITQTSGPTPQTVTVSAVPGSINASLISVTGGGAVNGSGTVGFTVNVLPGAAPGTTTFTIQGAGGGQTHTAIVTVNIVVLGSFQLNASPASLTVVDGTTGVVTLAVVPQNNFSGNVAITVAATGAQVSGPSSIAAGSSGSYTVTPTAASGSITFTGTAQGITQTANVSVSLVAGFSLSAGAVSGFAGGTVPVVVTVTRIGNFNGDVNVSAGATPGGVTLSPATVLVPAGSSTAAFTATLGPNAVAGNLNFTGVAVGGTLPVSTAASLTIGTAFALSSGSFSGFLGSTVPITVTVTRAQGFTGTVDVAPTGSLTGVTLAPASVSVGPNATTATFIATLGNNAVSGSITFSGTSGPNTATTTATLTVASPFTLSAGAVSAFLGSTATITVTVNRAQGFTATVDVAPTGSLTGVTLAPASVTVASNATTATFTATIGNNAVSGSITFSGTSGSFSATTTAAVNIAAPFSLSSGTFFGFFGSTTTITITVNRAPNFTGTVVVTPTGSLTGVTLSPASVSVASNATTAAFSAAIGGNAVSGPLPFSGASGNFSATTTANLNVANPFSLAGGGNLGNLAPGDSAIGTVTVTLSAGFTGPVTLSATSSSGVVSAGLSVTSLTSSGQSILTASVSSAATPGSATVTVTATSGTVSQSVTFTLTIAPPPIQFSVSLSPSPVRVFTNQGTQATVTVTFNPGFNGPVTVNAPGAPTGISSITPVGSNVLNASGSVTYNLVGNGVGSGTLTFTATDAQNNSVQASQPYVAANPFALSVSPNPRFLFNATSRNVVATVTPAIGFTGSLTVTGHGAGGANGALPTGATFNSGTPSVQVVNIVSGPVQVTFTYDVAANAPVGSTSGAVTAVTANTLFTATQATTLDVKPPFTAQLAAGSAGPFTVPVGGSNNVTANVTIDPNFGQSVEVKPTGAFLNLSGPITPASVTLNSSGSAQFTLSGGTPIGLQNVSVTAGIPNVAGATYSVVMPFQYNVQGYSLSLGAFPSPYFISDKKTFPVLVTPTGPFFGSVTVTASNPGSPFTLAPTSAGSNTVNLSTGSPLSANFDASSTGVLADAGPSKTVGTFTGAASGSPNLSMPPVVLLNAGPVAVTAPFTDIAAITQSPAAGVVFTGATGLLTDQQAFPNQTIITQTITADLSWPGGSVTVSASPPGGSTLQACAGGTAACLSSANVVVFPQVPGVQTWFLKTAATEPSGLKTIGFQGVFTGAGGTYTNPVNVNATVTPPFTLVETIPLTTTTPAPATVGDLTDMSVRFNFASGWSGPVDAKALAPPTGVVPSTISPATPGSNLSVLRFGINGSATPGVTAPFNVTASTAAGNTYTGGTPLPVRLEILNAFALSASPSPASYLLGTQTSGTIITSIAYGSGFTGSTTFNATAGPKMINLACFMGTSVPCTNLAISGSTAVMITFSNAPSVVGGQSEVLVITLNGTIGGFPVTKTVNVTVNFVTSGAGTFDLAIDPITSSASPDQYNGPVPVSYTVDVISQNGFTGNVTITFGASTGGKVRPCGDPLAGSCGGPTSPSPQVVPAGSSVLLFYTALTSTGQVNDGPDQILITATGTAPTVNKTVFVRVGKPDLKIVAPSGLSVPGLGGSISATVTVDPKSGFVDDVNTLFDGDSGLSTCTPPGLTFITSSPPFFLIPAGSSAAFTVTNLSSPFVGVAAYGTFAGGFASVCSNSSTTQGGGGIYMYHGGAVPMRGGSPQASLMKAKPKGSADLAVAAQEITYSPAFPKEGDVVKFRARVSNLGNAEVSDVEVALTLDKAIVSRERVRVAPQSTSAVELSWKAQRLQGRPLALVVDPAQETGDSDRRNNQVVLKGLFVEPPSRIPLRRERLTLSVRNEQCAGLRFRSASQSGCGGAVDLEVFPVILDTGTLEVQLAAPEGGLRDLGAMPLTGMGQVPSEDLQPNGRFEEGHTYLVKSRNQFALVRILRIRSSVNPKLGVVDRGGAVDRRGGRTGRDLGRVTGDTLEDLKDQERLDRVLGSAQITIELEWILQEDGSASFQ